MQTSSGYNITWDMLSALGAEAQFPQVAFAIYNLIAGKERLPLP